MNLKTLQQSELKRFDEKFPPDKVSWSLEEDKKIKYFIFSSIEKAHTLGKEEMMEQIRLEIACYSPLSAKDTKALLKIIKNK